jgi:hypothetical protein
VVEGRAPILLQGRAAGNKHRRALGGRRNNLRAGAARRMPRREAGVATRRTTRVFIETHERWVVRRPEGLRREWCAGCRSEAEHLAAETAARAAGLTLRALCRMIEEGRLHSTETPDGALFVCVRSLTEQTSKGD